MKKYETCFMFGVLLITGQLSLLHADANSAGRTAKIIKSRQESFSCENFRKALPENFVQGFIEVPEDWSEPKSQVLQVFYYGLPEIANSTRPVVLIINGGPSFPSQSTYESMAGELKQKQIPFIFFDQRGTGCSSAYPKLSKQSMSRLHFYGSSDIVRDAEAIRAKVLGSSKWRVFGHSFGAKAALRYVSMFPAGLEKVIIAGDSVGDGSEKTVCLLKEKIRKNIGTFDALISTYPKLAETLQKLHNTIPANYCYQDETGLLRLCGYDVIRALGHGLSPERFSRINGLLSGLLQTDGKVNFMELDKIMESRLWYNVDTVAAIVWQQDYSLFYKNRPACLEALSQLASENIKPKPYALESCFAKRPLEGLPRVYRGNGSVLSWKEVRAGLTLNTDLSVIEFRGSEDTLNSDSGNCNKVGMEASPLTEQAFLRWKTRTIEGMDHIGVFKLSEFWAELAAS